MATGIPALTTARLILYPLVMADAPAIQTAFPRWDIVRFLVNSVPWPYPPDGAETFLRDVALPGMAHGIEWHWSLRPKAAPETLIGTITLHDKPDDHRGFWLDPDWRGQGLMTEACDTVTDYWFDVLDRPVLRVLKAAANVKSRRISERSGMRMIGTKQADYVSGHLTTEIWEITREEWHRRAANR